MSHDSSPGPDDIHYHLIKYLSADSLQSLLVVFNLIWESGFFPPSWAKATAVPIPKPGKEPSKKAADNIKFQFLFQKTSIHLLSKILFSSVIQAWAN